MITEPKLQERGAINYVGIRSRISMSEMGTLPPLWDEVFGYLGSKGIAPAGAPFWRYRIVDMANTMEIDVGVPVAAPVAGNGRIIADTLPAGTYTTLIYTGRFDDDGLMLATRDLLEWAGKNGVVWDKWPSGATGEGWRARIENYWTDPKTQPDPTKNQTELAFKVADK